jgi:ornithine carbamoyltransferase
MLKGKSFLTLQDFDASGIKKILDIADIVKKEYEKGKLRKILSDKSLAMIFQKPSTRTKVSFHLAMSQLGGTVITMDVGSMQISRGETIEDTGKNLSRYVDSIMARVYNHNDLVRLSKSATVPVINGLSDLYHPCQILGDLQTFREKKGKIEGRKFSYVGDGNNIANSLLIGCSKLGIDISIAAPSRYKPFEDAINISKIFANVSGSNISITEDPEEAVFDADAIYTDVWVSMGSEDKSEEKLNVFKYKYQVTSDLMEKAKPNALFMHCLPMHREIEVTSEVADGPQSVIWDQAENRLHAQKALLCLLLEENLPWSI